MVSHPGTASLRVLAEPFSLHLSLSSPPRVEAQISAAAEGSMVGSGPATPWTVCRAGSGLCATSQRLCSEGFLDVTEHLGSVMTSEHRTARLCDPESPWTLSQWCRGSSLRQTAMDLG